MKLHILLSVLIHSCLCAQQDPINTNIVFESVERAFDLSSQIAKITNKITVKNSGPAPINNFLFSANEQISAAYILAQISSSKTNLKVKEIKLGEEPDKKFWRIQLINNLPPGESLTVDLNEFWTDVIHPYPQSITQKEKQLVKYIGNTVLYSPYKINTISTTVTLHTRNVENYTKLKSTSFVEGTLTYGPYTNIAPWTVNEFEVHYENSSPFLVIKNLVRVIEVSHWGNIAVEETVDLIHTGAKLKGPFSRYDYQRESSTGQPSIKSFKMMLPAAAIGTYYRDDIGNISTSYMRVMKDAVELELRPRFPLFGGWQTRHMVGYNVPSYEYLYNYSEEYLLKMRIVDHIFDDMVIEQLTTKIILPEGVSNIDFVTPYPVQRLPDTVHHTYLDTTGRLVITLTNRNLVENHIQDFKLRYRFASVLMLQEPILLVVALYALFVMVIVYVRLDFSLVKNKTFENKIRMAGITEKILLHHEKRSYVYRLFDLHMERLKANKDLFTFQQTMKGLYEEHRVESLMIAEQIPKLRFLSLEAYDKHNELQKLNKQLKNLYTSHHLLYSEKLVPGKISRAMFVDAENQFYKRRNDLVEGIYSILRTLS